MAWLMPVVGLIPDSVYVSLGDGPRIARRRLDLTCFSEVALYSLCSSVTAFARALSV